MIRNSKQRDAISSVFSEHKRPLSPEEVRELSAAEIPGIGIATIYRNIKSLVKAGVLRVVEIPGSTPRYELADLGHHHHFQCSYCLKVFDVHACPGDLKRLAPPGFQVTSHAITFYGHCPTCTQSQPGREDEP